jgi:hypothetical protein
MFTEKGLRQMRWDRKIKGPEKGWNRIVSIPAPTNPIPIDNMTGRESSPTGAAEEKVGRGRPRRPIRRGTSRPPAWPPAHAGRLSESQCSATEGILGATRGFPVPGGPAARPRQRRRLANLWPWLRFGTINACLRLYLRTT